MTPLADALDAIYRSRWSFRSVRASGVAGGEPSRLWLERPDRLRTEHDREIGTSTVVRSGGRWSRWDPTSGGMVGNDQEVYLGDDGGLSPLMDPSILLAARLDVVGEVEALGRRAIALRAEPRGRGEIMEPGWSIDAGGLEVTLDLDRGVALRAGDARLTEVAFDEDIPPETFVLEFPAGETPKDARVAPHRDIEVSEAASIVAFQVLLPGWLPDGTRPIRCSVPGEEPFDRLHLTYVVDPGAVHTIAISEGPRVIAEEASIWSDWRTVTLGDVRLLVREDRGLGWDQTIALTERGDTGVAISTDLPLEILVRIAGSLEPSG